AGGKALGPALEKVFGLGLNSPRKIGTRAPSWIRVRGSVVPMTGNNPTIEGLSGPERRRRRPTAEELPTVEETYAPDVTVSLVARRNGVQPNQLFHWRKLAAQGALTATAAEGEVVAAAEYRALQNQVRELQRLLGKKTMEAEILKDALEVAA